MPVIYTFGTTVFIPTSDEWPCLDVGEAQMPLILLFPGITVSRGSPWFFIDGNNDLVITSDDGAVSALRLELPFQQQFTLEVVFKPSALPYDLSDLNNRRLFIGAYDHQDNAAGVLISRMGLAIVAAYGNAVLPIAGSHTIFEEGEDYYTMRMVVDGEADTMDLYITKTDDIAVTGHQLRYTTPAPISPLGSIDSIYIDIVGTPSFPTVAKFSDMHAHCTACVYPNKRPIADPGPDQAANLGSIIRYDGSQSYDPEGATLTYKWALIDAPENSQFSSLGSGQPYDDGGPDDFTTIFQGGLDDFSSTNCPLLQPGDTLLFNGVYYEVSATRWVYNSTTGKYDRDPLSGWVDNQILITEDTMPKTDPAGQWKIFHTKAYFSNSSYVLPTAIPDVHGMYEVRLIVNDGQLNSLPTDAILQVSSVRLVLGCIPDLSWIWNYLSDYWKLVDGREVMNTVWSGFAQAAAAQLFTAWQIDYNKSLVDIQRTFQRRWLDYDTLKDEDDPSKAAIKIVRGPIVSANLWGFTPSSLNGKILQLVKDDGVVTDVKFGTHLNPDGSETADPLATLDAIADQVNNWMGYDLLATKLASMENPGLDGPWLVLSHPMLLMVRPNAGSDYANSLLGFSTTEYTQNDLVGVGKPVSGTYYCWLNTNPPVIDFTAEDLERDDLLITEEKGYFIQRVVAEDNLAMFELPVITGSSAEWLIPSLVTSGSIDFSAELVVPGDVARFEVTENSTGHQSTILCEVVGAKNEKLGFDPRPLLEKLAGYPDNYTVEFLGVKHVHYIPVSEYVLDIPRLQEVIVEPPSFLTQNAEFTIETVDDINAIVFSDGLFSLADPPPDTLWAEVTYLDNKPTIEANFGRLVNFKVEDLATRTDDLDYLSAVKGLWWAYFGGPSLYKVLAGCQILLGLPFAETRGTITDIDTAYSATLGRIVIQDKDNPTNLRTYFYPLNAGLWVKPDGTSLAVGDEVDDFTPLSGGIEVKDWLSSSEWYKTFVNTGNLLELDKFFRFLVRADADVFNVTNMIFAVDFVKKIKPHYTFPIFVLLKRLDTVEVDVQDSVKHNVYLHMWEHFDAYQYGAYRYDDVYGGGEWRHHWDATAYDDKFLYDRHRLAPQIAVWALMSMVMDGNTYWQYDTIWAYDDGGGLDRLSLHGPDSLPPPPYGPAFGVIKMDQKPPAGRYWRSKNL